MPDLMKTPSNRRYVINFQRKEPINKYDIWLSFNKHEQSGHVIVDSEHLADKDLVFKIYMNGKWVPILGIPVSYEGIIQALEELDRKKINIVPDFENGHIAVFRQGSDECDQLKDGGTLEEMLQSIYVPISRANEAKLGGIRSTVHERNNNDRYIEAKFKGYQGPNDNDRLYVSAMDIVQAINGIGGGIDFELELMGPDTRGGAKAELVPNSWDSNKYIRVRIRQQNEKLYIDGEEVLGVLKYILSNDPLASIYEEGEGIEINNNRVISNRLATDATNGGIRAASHDSHMDAIYGVQPKFGCSGIYDIETLLPINDHHLCITSTQIKDLLKVTDPMAQTFPIGTESGLYGRFENIGTELNPEYIPTLGINGVTEANIGRVPTVVPSQTSQSGYDIEWVKLSAGQVYDPLSSSSTPGQNYVIAAPQPNSGYLKWDGTFDTPPTNVSINPSLPTGTLIATYTIEGVVGHLYAPNSEYYGGEGININDRNYIGIDLDGAAADYVLGYDGNHVVWIPQRTTTYIAGEGIEIDNQSNIISGNIKEHSDNVFNATTAVNFRAISEGMVVRKAVLLILDNDVTTSTSLSPYNYYEVHLDTDDNPATLSFNIDDQLDIMNGNPVYALLTIGKNTVTVSVSEQDRPRTININNAIVNGELNSLYTHFLITLQFGIVKIEPLEDVAVVNI